MDQKIFQMVNYFKTTFYYTIWNIQHSATQSKNADGGYWLVGIVESSGYFWNFIHVTYQTDNAIISFC